MAEESPTPFVINSPADPEADASTVAIYANFANVLSSAEEFILRFCHRSLEEGERPREVVRVYLSLGHAKRLMAAMSTTIERHELMFGEIKTPELTEEGKRLVKQVEAEGADDNVS